MSDSNQTSRVATEGASPLPHDGIHVRQDGPRDAPALLLIHGTAASVRTWEPMVPLLSRAHRVVRIDLPGCGRSARPDGARYAIPDQALRVGEAIDRRGLERAVVVGHSSGGAVATALTEQRPDLVAAIALINTGPDMSAYTGGTVSPQAASWSDLTDDQVRRAVSDAFHPGFEIPQSFVDQFRDIDLRLFAAISQSLDAYLEERPLPERLAPLGKPLLVIFGREDRRWRPSSAADYSAVPGAEVAMLPGLGHSPNIEDPARTAAPLLAFAARHAS